MKPLEQELGLTMSVNKFDNVTVNQFEYYVPGEWKCNTCVFTLHKKSLSAIDGSVGQIPTCADTIEDCPNCKTPMVRLTWKDLHQDYAQHIGRMQQSINDFISNCCDEEPIRIHLDAHDYFLLSKDEDQYAWTFYHLDQVQAYPGNVHIFNLPLHALEFLAYLISHNQPDEGKVN